MRIRNRKDNFRHRNAHLRRGMEKDESGHWHESTCDATAPTHDVMKSDFAAHTFDDGIVTKPADYGVVGEKKFTCTVCEYSYTQEIDALGAKTTLFRLLTI